MTKDLKKIIATAIATGSIVSGAIYGAGKLNCDYVVLHKQEEICISEELHDSIKSQLRVNSGFGGVKFGGE